MYCVLVQAGSVRSVLRVTSADGCPGAASLPVGNPSTGSLLLMEPSDLPSNPLWLSTVDGTLIAGAVASLWLLAWSIRQVRRTVE